MAAEPAGAAFWSGLKPGCVEGLRIGREWSCWRLFVFTLIVKRGAADATAGAGFFGLMWRLNFGILPTAGAGFSAGMAGDAGVAGFSAGRAGDAGFSAKRAGDAGFSAGRAGDAGAAGTAGRGKISRLAVFSASSVFSRCTCKDSASFARIALASSAERESFFARLASRPVLSAPFNASRNTPRSYLATTLIEVAASTPFSRATRSTSALVTPASFASSYTLINRISMKDQC